MVVSILRNRCLSFNWLIHSILIAGYAAVVVPVSGEPYWSFESRNTFETFTQTQSRTTQLQIDKFVPANILFSDGSSLKTSDGNLTTLIVGSGKSGSYSEGAESGALFNHISGFYQLSNIHVIISDYHNHCLRLVDRVSNETLHYSGICATSGYRDGGSDLALYSNPYDITRDIKILTRLFVADLSNNVIRELNTVLVVVKTFFKGDDRFYPSCIAQHSVTGDLYITSSSQIFFLTYKDKSMTLLAGSQSQPGFNDGPFAESLFNYPKDILLNNDQQLVIADSLNNRLRVMDLQEKTTSSVCSGKTGHSDGSLKDCTLYHPSSLMVAYSDLYVGERGRIRRIQGITGDNNLDSDRNSGLLSTTKRPAVSALVIKVTAPIGSSVIIVLAALCGYCCYRKSQISRNRQRYDNTDGTSAPKEDEDPYLLPEPRYSKIDYSKVQVRQPIEVPPPVPRKPEDFQYSYAIIPQHGASSPKADQHLATSDEYYNVHHQTRALASGDDSQYGPEAKDITYLPILP